MSDEMISPLVPSTTRGRYALDDPDDGHELTSGEPIVIVLGSTGSLGGLNMAACSLRSSAARTRYGDVHRPSQPAWSLACAEWPMSQQKASPNACRRRASPIETRSSSMPGSLSL